MIYTHRQYFFCLRIFQPFPSTQTSVGSWCVVLFRLLFSPNGTSIKHTYYNGFMLYCRVSDEKGGSVTVYSEQWSAIMHIPYHTPNAPILATWNNPLHIRQPLLAKIANQTLWDETKYLLHEISRPQTLPRVKSWLFFTNLSHSLACCLAECQQQFEVNLDRSLSFLISITSDSLHNLSGV